MLGVAETEGAAVVFDPVVLVVATVVLVVLVVLVVVVGAAETRADNVNSAMRTTEHHTVTRMDGYSITTSRRDPRVVERETIR